MQIWELIVAWATAVVGIGYFFEYSEKTIKQDVKLETSQKILNFSNTSVLEIFTSSNRIFLKLFDQVYSGNFFKIKYLNLIWIWIIATELFAIILSLTAFLLNISREISITSILLLSSFSGIFIFVIIVFGNYEKLLFIEEKKDILINFIFFCMLIIMIIKPSFLAFATFAAVFVALFILSNSIRSVYFNSNLFEISPLNSLFSSIFFIFILSFLNSDASKTFFLDINQFGWIILTFGFLNILADSFSLIETRFILSESVGKSLVGFLFLLLIDIIATALIFLTIPLSSGYWQMFFEAIYFHGERPWLGILFWSTFMTSLLFYLFLLSCGILAILHKTLKKYTYLEKFMDIKTRPIRSLGQIAIIITTFFFFCYGVIEFLK